MIAALAHLPILQVVVPLIGAPVCTLLGTRRLARWLATIVAALGLAGALTLMGMVHPDGTIHYAVGGWPAPWGIEIRIDMFAAVLLSLVFGLGFLGLVVDRGTGSSAVADNGALFYATWLLLLAGFAGIVVSGDFFNIFVFLEISSLSTYILIAARQSGPAVRWALNYLFFGAVGATFFLIGVGLLFIASGGLGLEYVANYVAGNGADGLLYTGAAFIFVGLLLKAALFPMHVWLPRTYTHAPDTVTIFIAGTSVKVSLYVLLRVYAEVLRPGLGPVEAEFTAILVVFASLAMVAGSVLAARQRDAKMLLGYSSVAHIGYIVAGISLMTPNSIAGAVLHLVNHGVAKAALFVAVAAIALRTGQTTVAGMAGIARQMPLTFAGLTIAGFSLVGVPLTGGFLSKALLVLGGLESGFIGWLAIAAIAVGSVLALRYVWRLVEPAWFGTADEAYAEAPLRFLVPLWVLVLMTIALGVLPVMGVDIAAEIGRHLLSAEGGE